MLSLPAKAMLPVALSLPEGFDLPSERVTITAFRPTVQTGGSDLRQ